MRNRWRVFLLFTIFLALVAINVYRRWPTVARTSWAEGYTDKGFQAVRIGMTRDEVYALIGRPLEVDDKEDPEEHNVYQVEHWSRSQIGYLTREISFEKGVVKGMAGQVLPGWGDSRAYD